jgi:hypothetical protein
MIIMETPGNMQETVQLMGRVRRLNSHSMFRDKKQRHVTYYFLVGEVTSVLNVRQLKELVGSDSFSTLLSKALALFVPTDQLYSFREWYQSHASNFTYHAFSKLVDDTKTPEELAYETCVTNVQTFNEMLDEFK